MQNKLPQFEANQVLSNVHLNQFVEYLEEQDRLTRNHLLGAGIISGLDVKRESAATISIYEGAAVSSAGYLIIPGSVRQLNADDKGRKFITYNRRRKFEPKNLLSPYKGDFETLADGYSLFNGTANEISTLIESTAPATTDVNVKNLTESDLANKVVILFLEIKVKELKNCEGEDCIDLGKEISYSVLPLLVSKSDADMILKNESALSSSLDNAAAVHLAWQLTDIVVPRPDLTAIHADLIMQDLASIYAKVVLQINERLKTVHTVIDNSLKKILKTNTTPIADFQKKLEHFMNIRLDQKLPVVYQYVYDFVCDYAAAYRELQDAVHEYASYELPSGDAFPCHIRLGEVPASNSNVTHSFDFPPSVYRHGFVNARNVERQRKTFHDLQILFARLNSMVENFDPMKMRQEIRLTPSNEPGKALSERSIPFYYDEDNNKRPAVLNVWNSEWYRQGKLNRIFNYFTNANKPEKDKFRDNRQPATDDPSFFPLLYNHERSNFYRVEGYLGLQYADVFKELRTYISNYNLPFDLQLVGLNKATQLVIKEMRLRFNDLDSMYNVMCEEVLCHLRTTHNYFGNIRLTKRRFIRPIISTMTEFIPETSEDETLVKSELLEKKTIFFKAKREKTPQEAKGETKMAKLSHLGVADSTADIVQKIGSKIPTKDVGNILGTVFRNEPTPASPFILKLIAAIEKLIKSLKEDFYDFNSDEYKTSLDDMQEETKNFILFVKSQRPELLLDDSNMDKSESLGYLERLLYECDFEKIWAIDEERSKREKELGFNTNLTQFITMHPGMEHKAGVWKNGTFVFVFDRDGSVIADFCLPYRCCNGMNTTQFVLGVLQTLWFDGQVLDKDGAPVEKAKVILNNEELVVDKNGRFRKIIPPNTFLVLKVSADGFESSEMSITSLDESISQTITLLKKAQIPKVSLTIKVTNNAGVALADTELKAEDVTVKTNNAGEATMQVKANASITLVISKQGFITRNEIIETQAAAISLSYKLTQVIKLAGAITNFANQPVLNAKVLIDDKLVTVKENKYEAELEDSRTYRLTVTAPDLQTFIKDVTTGFTDINLPIVMDRIKTVSVRVGVYISVNIPRPPAVTPAPTHIDPRILVTRRTTLSPTVASTILRRDLPIERTTVPPTAPPDKFSLMDNGNVSSFVDDKAQAFNTNLRLFESQEVLSTHRLVIKDNASSMGFATALTVTDSDVLALVRSIRGKQPEGQFSFLIGIEGGGTGANSIAKFNEVMSKAFSFAQTVQWAAGKTIDVRVFTSSDAEEISALLKNNQIPFIPKRFNV
jgi:hypothetical protein